MFLKLKVSRKQYTDIYVEVPDDFETKKLMRAVNSPLIGAVAERTTAEIDWDDFGWEEDVTVQQINIVSEDEFNSFDGETLDVSQLS